MHSDFQSLMTASAEMTALVGYVNEKQREVNLKMLQKMFSRKCNLFIQNRTSWLTSWSLFRPG